MAEVMHGKTLEELQELSHRFRRMMQGNPTSEEPREALGDLVALQVVRKYPVRIISAPCCRGWNWKRVSKELASQMGRALFHRQSYPYLSSQARDQKMYSDSAVLG